MAENATTTSRVYFPNGGIVRRRPSILERAHLDLVRALANTPPPRIRGAADLADVEAVADHLREVFLAVTAYEEAVIADAMGHLPVSRANHDEVESLLWAMLNEDDHHHLPRWLDQAGCHLELPALAA
jgi:hypothetical protein